MLLLLPRFRPGGLVVGVSLLAAAASAQQTVTVYRCPGPPVLYTDALTAAEAREKGCRPIEGGPITVIPAPRPRGGSAPASAASAPRPADSKVDPSVQRQRDADARRILADELRREEDKLATLKREYNNGEPERLGEERNYQKYLDRVAALKASIARAESDIAAIKRELAKLGP